MPLAWFAALTFFAALIPPVRIALKIYVHEMPGATADDAARVAAALKRGFYADFESTFAERGRAYAVLLSQRFKR